MTTIEKLSQWSFYHLHPHPTLHCYDDGGFALDWHHQGTILIVRVRPTALAIRIDRHNVTQNNQCTITQCAMEELHTTFHSFVTPWLAQYKIFLRPNRCL